MTNNRYNQSDLLLERALKTIPLGSQTFSKSITQYPRGVSPLFITHGKGSHVWDVDGNEYIDFVNGLCAVSLGYADSDVNAAVTEQLSKGVIFSLPSPLEVEVAEILIDLVPCAEMVRFGKNGTDATSASIRLSRSYTGRDHVLVCGYHGWQDWYIGSTARNSGVPDDVKNLTHSFQYNNIGSLEKWFQQYPNDVAAVIMEPMNIAWPNGDFLQKVKEITHQYGAVFIFDETITGCRFSKGGAQELFNVTPDLATFGKGLGNGFPLSAVVGKKEIMQVMEDIFFSGTFGGETASLAAAKIVLTKVKHEDIIEKLARTGQKLLDDVHKLINKHDVGEFIQISGHPSWSILSISGAGQYNGLEVKSLFLQEVFKRGILTIGSHNISYAHNDADINSLLSAYDEVFPFVKDAIENVSLLEQLEAKPLEPLFKVR
jgi:glutamate-1-semialdehyde 2,1-aminomutase